MTPDELRRLAEHIIKPAGYYTPADQRRSYALIDFVLERDDHNCRTCGFTTFGIRMVDPYGPKRSVANVVACCADCEPIGAGGVFR